MEQPEARQRKAGLLRVVVVNALVLLGILWTTNTCSSLVLDLHQWIEPRWREDARPSLPNYPNPEEARAIFREFHLLQTEYAPFYGWRRLAFEGRYTTVDSTGERTHPIPAARSDPTRATLRFFGGSTMWGSGAADDETIPAYFNALAPDLEVHNHGESGFVSRQSLARLISLVNEGARMDWVVFYDGYNDVRSLCRFDVSLQGHIRERRIRDALRPPRHLLESLTGSSVRFLRRVLPRGWTGQRRRGESHAPSRCHVDPERPGRVIDTLLGNWRHARDVARAAGAEFVAVLQPVASVSEGRTELLVRDASFKGKAHERVYPELRRALAEADEPWIHDLSRLFDRDEYIFVDAAHVSPNGNRLMAEELHRILAPKLKIP